MKITLLVLAAGMGSRYGGLKQLDALGPNGETLMDYTIYDAIQAGFTKVVFVIREAMQPMFEDQIAAKFQGQIEIATVYQSLTLESGRGMVARKKPWGTAHAVHCAATELGAPFAVVNADDYYGRRSLDLVAAFLRTEVKAARHVLISFPLAKTLSAHGAVSRGICTLDDYGSLQAVVERKNISVKEKQIVYSEAGKSFPLNGTQPISMNLWGFHPSILALIGEAFEAFVASHLEKPQAEIYLPSVVNALLSAKQIEVKVLSSNATWMGLTYAADKVAVQNHFMQLHATGQYPEKLW